MTSKHCEAAIVSWNHVTTQVRHMLYPYVIPRRQTDVHDVGSDGEVSVIANLDPTDGNPVFN